MQWNRRKRLFGNLLTGTAALSLLVAPAAMIGCEEDEPIEELNEEIEEDIEDTVDEIDDEI